MNASSLLGGYTQAELDAAFALVAPEGNWKLPISATLPIASVTADDLAKIAFAVTFFTGSEAKLKYGKKAFTLTAPGYYAAVGA
jgi:hypothetical protein